MNANEYQALAARTECNQEAAAKRRLYADVESGNPLVATRLVHAALGLAGESGELSYAVEKWLQYGKPLDSVNILEEVGDCLWYLALACNALGLKLEDVMERNIEKLRKRYPEKYSDCRAAEEGRNREAERAVLETALDPINVEPAPVPINTIETYDAKSACPRGGCENVVSMVDAMESESHKRDYPGLCKVCNVARVHKTNTLGICPDCAHEIQAQERLDRRARARSLFGGEGLSENQIWG